MTESNTPDIHSEFDQAIENLPDSVDPAAVKRMRVVAHILDESIHIPGTDYSIGFDPIVGTIPVVGDVISGGLSLYIVAEAARLGVSYMTLLKMIANVTIDSVGGSIPYVGDIFDAAWKANKRNLELVLEDLMSEDPQTIDRDTTYTEIDIE
ncbi:MAG: DUF4112 domain-containing protein [Halobacteriaceae archaeon]